MKKLSILLLLTISPIFVFAQLFKKSSDMMNRHKQALSQLLARAQTPAASKATALKERVIGESVLDNTTTPATITDSSFFIYSANRGSVFNFFALDYDLSYPYYNSPVLNYDYQITKPQVLCDKAILYSKDASTGVFGPFGIFSYQYDANNNLVKYDELYSDSLNNQNDTYLTSFNAAANVTRAYGINHNSGTNDSNTIQYFSYDASGNLLKDSIYTYSGSGWSIYSKCNYTYDASNNLLKADYYLYTGSATGWVEKEQYLNTYNSSNQLLTVLLSYDDGSGFMARIKDTFSFTPGINYNTSWKEYQYNGSAWVPNFYIIDHVTSAGVVDTAYAMGPDASSTGFTPMQYIHITYTSFNNPLKALGYNYTGSGYSSTPSMIENFYYEQYDPSAVEKITTNSDNIKLYPNPSTGYITVSDLPQNTAVSINIMNIAGQVLSKQTVHCSGQSQQLDIYALTPGTYWVIVSNNSGSVLHKQAIVKQ